MRDPHTTERRRSSFPGGDDVHLLADNGAGLAESVCDATNPGVGGLLNQFPIWLQNVHVLGEDLSSDSLSVHFLTDTSDEMFNSGEGFLIDEIMLSCRKRPAGDTSLLATYEGDTVGQPPGDPDVGLAFYDHGTHLIEQVGFDGDRQLRSVDAVIDGGLQAYFTPEVDFSRFYLEYVFEILAEGANLVLATALHNLLTFFPAYGLLELRFGADYELRLVLTPPGGTSTELPISQSWSHQSYRFLWMIDTENDVFALWLDGAPLLTGQPFGFDVGFLDHFCFGSNFPTVVSQRLDDVRITDAGPFFSDGFESGNTSAWSMTVP